jgi:hypothetical protein
MLDCCHYCQKECSITTYRRRQGVHGDSLFLSECSGCGARWIQEWTLPMTHLSLLKGFNGVRRSRNVRVIPILMVTFLFLSPLFSEQLVGAQLTGAFGNATREAGTSTSDLVTTTNETDTEDESHLLKVNLFIFGIDNATENIVTYVTAKNTTKAFAGSSLEIDRLDNQSDGIGELFFTFPEIAMNPGEKFEACALKVSDEETPCTPGLTGQTNRTEVAQLLLSP